MTKIFIFTHFGLNIRHTFLYFVTLKGFVFIIRKLVFCNANNLQNRKTNMTKNCDKIMNHDISKKKKVIFLPYCSPLDTPPPLNLL